MTLLSRVMSLFPTIHVLAILSAFFYFFYSPSLMHVLLVIFAIYLLPLGCMRIHQYYYPIEPGLSNLSHEIYSPWWGSHQLQAIFNAIPTFEAILRLIPGLYSVWLRLWGSQIGNHVYWTPRVDLTDRSLMIIGENVIFGHQSAGYAHVIIKKNNHLLLYVKPITIGDHVFIGAGSRLGPGVKIDDDIILPVLTDVKVNQHIVVGDMTCPLGE